MKKILTILLAYGMFIQANLACSCFVPNSFCESIRSSNNDLNTDLILRGTIKDIPMSGKEATIQEVIYGHITDSSIIINGNDCTLNYWGLEDGKEYLIALTTRYGNYTLVDCAISFLEIENEVLIGQIAPGVNQLNYVDLTTISDCSHIFNISNSSLTTDMDIDASIEMFPNPTTSELKIKNLNSSAEFTDMQLQIFDITGKQIASFKKEDELLPSEIWEINLQDIPGGTYIVKVSNQQQSKIFKIIKLSN